MSAPESQTSYFPALDGFRLICCMFVVAGHSFVFHPAAKYLSSLSGMGVHLFFSLSGFLITTLLLRERERRGSFDLKAFYLRRILRIFPVYYSALAVAGVLMLVLGTRYTHPFGVTMEQLDLPRLFATHFVFMANWYDQVLPTSLDVLWSISVEEQFYMVFPLAMLLAAGKRPAAWPIAVGVIVAWGVRAWLAVHNPGGIYRNTFATGDHLLFGALLAQACQSSQALRDWFSRLGAVAQWSALGLVFAVAALSPESPVMYFTKTLLSAAVSTLCVAVLAYGSGSFGRLLALPSVRAAGQLTYAGYVFHMYAVAVGWWVAAQITADVVWAAPLRFALAAPLSLAIAWVSKVVIEKRAMQLKARFAR